MATTRLYLDTRRVKRNGGYPIKIVVNHIKDIMISTGHSALKSEWMNDEFTKSVPNYRAKNANIAALRLNIERILLDLERDGKLHKLSDKQLKEIITSPGEDRPKSSFMNTFRRFAESREAESTKRLYLHTLEKVTLFDERVTFENVNLNWLNNFDAFLSNGGESTNTRAIHLRNIRAVFNHAIDYEITTNYPFRKFKIKTEKTRHRDLDINEITQIIRYSGKWEMFRDVLMLSFYLIGINLKDLLHARKTDVSKGRLEYRRMKTKKLYSIKIEPEAQRIIDKYPDNEYLVNFIRTYKNYDGFKRGMNYALKKLTDEGGEIINPLLSPYYSRHSWATIAASLDIPKETISAALGHSIGSEITSIYINFDQRKIDEANRKVIDAIMNVR